MQTVKGDGLPVTTRGLVHIYRSEDHDVAALSGVDLRVSAGEVVGLLGPSGAGKSTLLSLLGGLERPSAGKVFVGDHELAQMSAPDLNRLRTRTVRLMLQGARRNLLPYLTIRQNVEFAQSVVAAGRDALPKPVEVLESVGLRTRPDDQLTSLSPGQLQLAAMAVALAARPAVLLADEPTSQLDHESRDTVIRTMHTINAEFGTTIILVTHDPEVADALPRTITIRDGRIGGEGREGEEYAVVTADGFLPLTPQAIEKLPPGTLVRIHEDGDDFRIIREQA